MDENIFRKREILLYNVIGIAGSMQNYPKIWIDMATVMKLIYTQKIKEIE